MACIIAELLLFSITLAPWRIIRFTASICRSSYGAALVGVMHLHFEIFHANMKILAIGKKADVIANIER
jgi:hypothetical protein